MGDPQAVIALALTLIAHVASVPPNAEKYAPDLVEQQTRIWPSAPTPWTLAGLVEQESCSPTVRSPKCWNPRAELRTSREYGFGLGQITVAYDTAGHVRFNNFEMLRRKYRSLSDWQWSGRYDPKYQLAALVEMTKDLWRKSPPAATTDDHWAFDLVAYNGGFGGLLQDRRLCDNTPGCDATRWFGNVETHSLKSRVPRRAYGGQSWYSISRGYVRNILKKRRAKYKRFWEEKRRSSWWPF